MNSIADRTTPPLPVRAAALSVHLARDLEALHRNLLSMCAHVEELVHKAVRALNGPAPGLADELVQADEQVDRWDVRIEEESLRILALHRPVAIDLRRVAAVLRIAGDLERVADLGVNIAERANGLRQYPEILVPEKLETMAGVALTMLRDSIDALVAVDTHLAREVCARDDQVDQLNDRITQELVEAMRRWPQLVRPSMHLFSATRQIERVADHATNIAEGVVYLAEGEIIRHQRRSTDWAHHGSAVHTHNRR